ncbi:MAG TPA: hypothetical protein PKV41_00610 [Candidatus Omnitrophota bacterium]|nr:hypothetical protein [Candidatus Omnitrophota bacterium]
MKKKIVLTAVMSILVLSLSNQAWAKDCKRGRCDDDGYQVFKKAVKILNIAINDDCHKGRGGSCVIVKTSPRRAWDFYNPRKICYNRSHRACASCRNHHKNWKQYSKCHDCRR